MFYKLLNLVINFAELILRWLPSSLVVYLAFLFEILIIHGVMLWNVRVAFSRTRFLAILREPVNRSRSNKLYNVPLIFLHLPKWSPFLSNFTEPRKFQNCQIHFLQRDALLSCLYRFLPHFVYITDYRWWIIYSMSTLVSGKCLEY